MTTRIPTREIWFDLDRFRTKNYCETKIENNAFKIIFQNEKRAKKKGAAPSLIFYSRIKGGSCVGGVVFMPRNRPGLYLAPLFCSFCLGMFVLFASSGKTLILSG